MQISEYQRPPEDTGIGFHYVAASTMGWDLAKFKHWANEIRAMGGRWVVILNPTPEIVAYCLSIGLEPLCRHYIERCGAQPIGAEALDFSQKQVQAGAKYIIYPGNEVNNADENPGDVVANPYDLAKAWVPWTKAIIGFGGYPSLPAFSPGGTWNDLLYLSTFLESVFQIEPNAVETIFKQGAWVAVHNYTLNHPVDYKKIGNDPNLPDYRSSFLGYQLVAERVFKRIGIVISVVSTEGGPVPFVADDATFPALTEHTHADIAFGMARYMATAEDWYFANNYWILVNYAAGHLDQRWETAAWCKPDRQLPVVQIFKDNHGWPVRQLKVADSPPLEPPTEGEGNMGVTITLDDPIIVQNEQLFRAWVAAGAIKNGFTTFEAGQNKDRVVTPELLKMSVGECKAKADEAVLLANRFPF